MSFRKETAPYYGEPLQHHRTGWLWIVTPISLADLSEQATSERMRHGYVAVDLSYHGSLRLGAAFCCIRRDQQNINTERHAPSLQDAPACLSYLPEFSLASYSTSPATQLCFSGLLLPHSRPYSLPPPLAPHPSIMSCMRSVPLEKEIAG